MSRLATCAAAAALAAALATLPLASAEVLRLKPKYTNRVLSAVPNAAAMTTRIWSPGLDDGFVPQGLTFLDGAIYVGAYRSEDPKQGRGPCRLYRLDPRNGGITGTLDLPPQCGHAGGLARGRAGRLWVADTRMIFEIGLGAPDNSSIGSVLRSVRLGGNLKGSFAAGTVDALWLGTYSKESWAWLYKVPLERLEAGIYTLSEKDATAAVALPHKSQGAAFDAVGQLWVTRSGAEFGQLIQIDPGSGIVLQRFDMPAGIEGISFEPGGGLWAVSEAGSKRWLAWATFFPVIFRLEPARLH